jgi:hypothetical protein
LDRESSAMMAAPHIATAALAFVVLTAPAVKADPARFAIFVGSNLGDRHEPILHHAEDDAARLAQTFRTLGDFPADQVLLMTAVTAAELRDAIIRLNARVREHPDGVLLVFYSGHADAEALHLAGTHLPLAELKALLVGSPATSRLLMVDACQSGSLISVKGAHPAPAFNVTQLDEGVPEGFAVLTSSTATENAQESFALGGSFFTYYLNSGLLGAADQNHDGAVTLSEAYAFASSETRAATASSPAGQQTPAFQFMLGGRHDLVLTRPGRSDVRLGRLAFASAGRYVVQRWDLGGLSPPLAEIAASEPGATLTLPPGRYRVTLRGERTTAERDATVSGGETSSLAASSMIPMDRSRVVRKGGTRPSATGVTAGVGWHTDELGNQSLSLGAGPLGLVTLRHDRRHVSLEARLAAEGESQGSTGFVLHNLGLSATLAALVPIDLPHLTLSVGLEGGVILVRQTLTLKPTEPQLDVLPANPSQHGPIWSDGIQLGPLLQADFPLTESLYARLDAAAPFRMFGPSPTGSTLVEHGFRAQLVAAMGFTF